MFPVMNSPATPNPVEASSDKESFAVEKLQHYGIVQADRRVKVYETEYQKFVVIQTLVLLSSSL